MSASLVYFKRLILHLNLRTFWFHFCPAEEWKRFHISTRPVIAIIVLQNQDLDYISPNLDYNSQQKCEANEIHYIKSVKKYASFSWKCSKTLQKSPVADKSETPRPHCILSFWYRLTTNMVRFAAIFVVKQ